jgi:hypothetical protein
MSEAQPPTEFLPIFNPANYPDDARNSIGGGGGAGSYVNFPTAQGTETFPGGVVWGDGSYTNSAYPPTQVDSASNSYNQIYWSYWPYSGGSGWTEKSNGLKAGYAWFFCYAGSMTSPGYAVSTPTIGYCLDQYAGGTDAPSPGSNTGVYIMVSNYPRAPFPASNSASYDVLCNAFTAYDSNGFLFVDCSVDGKIVAVTDSRGIYPIIASADFGSSVIETPFTAPIIYPGVRVYPQGLQVSNTGQFVVSSLLSPENLTDSQPYGQINVYQSTEFGANPGVILTIPNVMDYFYKNIGPPDDWQPMQNVFSGIAQSKNGRVICVPYTTGAGSGFKYGEQINAYISTDYGRTFELRERLFWYGGYTNGWPITQCIAISGNGQYIYIGGMKNNRFSTSTGGFLIYSSDYGATFQSAQTLTFASPSTYADVVAETNWVRCTDSGLGVIAGKSVTDGSNTTIYYSTQGGKSMQTYYSGGAAQKFFNVFMNGSGQTIGATVVGANGPNGGYPGGSSEGLPVINNYGL